MTDMSYRVTFVCTGNICRSPMAESIARHHIAEAGLDVTVDSSGTGGWHVGDPADNRTVSTLRRAGYGATHSARQFDVAWFDDYDLIIALDHGHLSDLRRMAPDEVGRAKIRMLREFDPDADDLEVPDPYYGDLAGFEEVLHMIEAAMPGLLAHIRPAATQR